MIYYHIVNYQQTLGVRGLNQMLQIGQCAKMRSHTIKVASGIAVVIAIAILYHRRDPDRSCSQRLDVIQFLFDSLEVAAVYALAGRRVVIPVGIIIRHVAIEKAIGDDLVNTLPLPEILRIRASNECDEQAASACTTAENSHRGDSG